MKNIKIIIATHKKYLLPENSIYLPLHVGAEGKDQLGYKGDNTGENISVKNSSYCELTGLYWAWKNLDYDYLGLVHYRRHFSVRKQNDVWESIMSKNEAQELCEKYNIILPNRRKYYIETLRSHYAHTHYQEHLDITRDVLKCSYFELLEQYDSTLKQTYGYMFNMFLMKKKLVDEYCTFLFSVLFELEKRTNTYELSTYHARFYGRISEILFNVWLNKKKEEDRTLKITEIGYIYMEPVNWWKKGHAFLTAKFMGKRYESSF